MVACSLGFDAAGLAVPAPGEVDGGAVPDPTRAAVDASAPASSDASTSTATGYCKARPVPPTLCADFDDAAIPGPFAALEVNGGGTVDVRDGAMVVTLPAIAGSAGAAVVTNTQSPTQSCILELDVTIEAFGVGDPLDLLRVVNGRQRLGLEVATSGAVSFDEDVVLPGGAAVDRTIATTGALAPGKHRVRWEMTFVGDTVTTRILVDAIPLGSLELPSTLFLQPLVVRVGDELVKATSAPWRVRLDDIVLDVR